MNRIFSRMPTQLPEPATTHPGYRPTQKLREDAEAALRDISYVLTLTQRVKASILEDRDEHRPSLAPRRFSF
jgi:hypothetical protein